MKLEDYSFRDLYHSIVYIRDLDIRNSIMVRNFPNHREVTGYLAYGYVDHEAGFTFEILSLAIERYREIIDLGPDDQTSAKVRIGSLKNHDLIILHDHYDKYQKKIQIINEGYMTNRSVELSREQKELDEFRNKEFPDDLLVILYKEGFKTEKVWARLESIPEVNMITGRLLNEPYQHFGIHRGELFRIIYYTIEPGNHILISIFN